MVMNDCDRFMTPYAELPPEEQARIDLAKAQIMDEARKTAWEGSMSESKAEYYAKHLEQQNPNEQMEIFQPVGLPTLLAQMVNEYHGALKLNGYSGFPDRLVEGFSQMLLACAQPLLTEYLTAITTPPSLVVKPTPTDYTRAEEAMEMARAGKGVSIARKHLGLDEEDKQLAYREFCARLALASPDAPTPSLEEWEAARKRVVPMSQQERIEIERGKRR